jgi:geranylgeranyl diphosphate synthase type II
MTERLGKYIDQYRDPIEQALEAHLPLSRQEHAARLNEALRYSIFPGGKRWRPMFSLLGAELVGGRPEQALPAACAMEYLHTSSIIFDDLPAMDDAGLRRGRETLHLVFGESIALLTALALFNQSYALLVSAAADRGRAEAAVRLVIEAVHCIGADGMIGGQVVDLVLQGTGQQVQTLASRNLKTTALLKLTLISGAMACGASVEQTESLAEFGDALGMAYQICDDLLDELVESRELGKPARQDSRHSRSNYVAEFGVAGAQQMAAGLVETGLGQLGARFGAHPAVDLIADASRLILSGMGRLAEAGA